MALPLLCRLQGGRPAVRRMRWPHCPQGGQGCGGHLGGLLLRGGGHVQGPEQVLLAVPANALQAQGPVGSTSSRPRLGPEAPVWPLRDIRHATHAPAKEPPVGGFKATHVWGERCVSLLVGHGADNARPVSGNC
jgi:hypothetical protein